MTWLVRLALIAITAALVNNFVLVRFLGICPFLGVSQNVKSASGMGIAVTFVMGMASLFTWMIQQWILEPLGIGFMQTIAFILTIAALVQFVEMVLQKTNQTLYKALGVYLPLITTNCAVLGVAILNIEQNYTLLESVVNGVFGGLGFTIAIVLMAGIREKLENAEIPKSLRGFPITLMAAGLMAIAFMGFSGLGR
ncbi:MAG TPA: electron transport complex subunit RsxA [Feifaniaceae bacterium]|nr:electron transport complex subunit RsxA [Feifaniaceae bacterium]